MSSTPRTAPGALDNSAFRRKITADGSSGYVAEDHRYHIYLSNGCPFSHRVLIGRKLKGLDKIISLDLVDYVKPDSGWIFSPEKSGCTPDTVNGKKTLREVYQIVEPGFSGRVTVPLLWDKKEGSAINNESSEILQMINSEFNSFCPSDAHKRLDLYPEELRKKIDSIDKWMSTDINNGVYKCGFATKQEDYDKAIDALYSALDKAEDLLSKNRYLTGNQITTVDINFFATLIRFDLVYATLFKCDRKRIVDYENIWPYLRDMYQVPGIGETCNIEHIRKGYFLTMSPEGIVSTGPVLNFDTPHGRDKKCYN